ncbi:MAG: endonuclease III [Candidatus Brocadiaceae bacterium]|nr:endonuclease III [Candidatus Brocadiaceae bacterium]
MTKSPFMVLISCILSLRTKDKVTGEASERLFKLANNPAKMLEISTKNIEKAIYPVGFYKTKAIRIKGICKSLLDDYRSVVPDEIDELLKLKGVGRKTANLVVTLGYGKLGICVDTHVHRISNRLGLVQTKTPEQTEFALRKKLPQKHWLIYNDLLVTYGQNLCVPISPWCSKCKIFKYCKRVGVKTSR